MPNDVAIFLDLDNLVIGANEAKFLFDINIILDHVKEITQGRIVLRRAYGDWRMAPDVPRQLAFAGFELQSAVRISSVDKNLADMQMVADAIETLIDGYSFQTYVLITGDRDFMPLVQILRKRGKHVIGIGLRHSTSGSLINLCDEFIFYDDLAAEHRKVTEDQIVEWLKESVTEAFKDSDRVQASVLRDHLQTVSDGQFANSPQGRSSFRKFLEKHGNLLRLEQDGTTLYACPPGRESEDDLHLSYRSSLKKRGLRVVPSAARLRVLKDTIALLRARKEASSWQDLVDELYAFYGRSDEPISKSFINDVLRVARRATVIEVGSNGNKPLASLPVTLALDGERAFQTAVMRCDATYLHEIQGLSDYPFELNEAALALYESAEYAGYLRALLQSYPGDGS